MTAQWIYTAKEVCEIFRIDEVTLWRWGNDGKLKPIRGVTRKRLYLVQEVEELKNHILEYSGKYEYVTSLPKTA